MVNFGNLKKKCQIFFPVFKKLLSLLNQKQTLFSGDVIDSRRIFLKGPSVVNFLCKDSPVFTVISLK
jgi:hypothetical protein